MSPADVTHLGSARPKVSVLMLTYNHARFIRQSIQSVLDQKTTFACELVIGEDGSKDGTADLVRDLQQQHPGIIRAFCSKKNLGVTRNFNRLLEAARGDYIALLEGDDYWTAPDKLQFQLEWLEARRDCALAFHPVELICEATAGPRGILPEEAPLRVTMEDLFQQNMVPTCSIVFRRGLLPRVPEWCAELPMLDWPLLILLTQCGPAGFIPRVMGAYRLHRDGIWTRMSPKQRSEAIASLLTQVNRHFDGRYWSTLRGRLAEVYAHLSWCHEKENRLSEALEANWKSIRAWPAGPARHKANLLRLGLKRLSPTAYVLLHRLKSAWPAPGTM